MQKKAGMIVDNWTRGYLLAKHCIEPSARVDDIEQFVDGFTIGSITVGKYERLEEHLIDCVPDCMFRDRVLDHLHSFKK